MSVARRGCEDASVLIIRSLKNKPDKKKEHEMELTIYALLEALFKLASNHNETFVTDAAELNVEETQED